ncbi:DUF1015 domain-containing protein [Anaerofustis stercorihominis]|uniref:DUF1015 domain-containing protein n=2 Tax=Anaerofustis stercorihominis TaxID=214853 RepID=B1C838_9FIRM|nr:DUF1015 family protein [Anaerofustis stercorihominis]EDS73175.1 hypothetical protein ANASTE_00895 [Anaerofustis stercorihominis DSM 17244]MCQ4794479.1 DUF1015 family protein [Anaerofustis stercorihominis]RGD74247.1 DUF1015 domain-containing protein [Anaerofustis stercorihominis]
MAVLKPFKGIRPDEKYVEDVSCLPYDVMNRDEAREMGKNEKSFLHIVRSDIDLDDSVDIHDEKVYEKARENFDKFLDKGYLKKEDKEVYYIYRQIMDGRVQTGICGCCSTFEYEQGIIKKHEFTRPEKEVDRINNFLACSAHTEPVFFAHRHNENVHNFIEDFTKNNKPVYDFVSDDGISHILWVVDKEEDVEKVREYYNNIDYLYIADGHHRTASSYEVGKRLREEAGDDVDREYNYILSVVFDSDELAIMDYNRVVKSLNGLDKDEFFSKVKEKFEVSEPSEEIIKPNKKHDFSMYVEGKWYLITAKEGTFDESNPVKSLDADILQENLLGPVLGIDDPRTNDNIEFVGGIRGLKELQERADKFGGAAFAVYPVTMDDLFGVADANMVMPPKSTWFEPKLRSGLFIHKI